MTSNEIRKKFLKYFENKNHQILPSAPLTTTEEKSVTDATLFNSAGMQPLVPYLLGQDHPKGDRLASSQKCIRTKDINSIGDSFHLTFFEMLGNWSLGDYFKEEAIEWSYEFLTSEEEGLGLDPDKIYITVFAGNDVADKDEESYNLWKKYIPENRIYFLEANWWEAGDNGPCGPDTEIFYDTTERGLGDLDQNNFIDADKKGEVVEIWNNVFMQYQKKDGQVIGNLPRNVVDTGAGLERFATVVNKKENVYETDLFIDIINDIKELSSNYINEDARIIADHVKAATFILIEGISPSNTDRGYILRRLMRRAIRLADRIGLPENSLMNIVPTIFRIYQGVYLESEFDNVQRAFEIEEKKFRKTLEKGVKIMEKIGQKEKILDAKMAFKLFSTYGFPVELIEEMAREKNITIDIKGFEKEMEIHQKLSRTAAQGKFKGGLTGTNEQEIKYHTATHLLHQALRDVLGNHVEQKGSNISPERLRFDFSHPKKMTDDEKEKVENIINQKIDDGLDVNNITLSKEKALKTGALHFFEDKYGDEISIYYIGEALENAFSKEFCGGPHVKNTSELGKFKIKKEEAISAGVRRIKGILE